MWLNHINPRPVQPTQVHRRHSRHTACLCPPHPTCGQGRGTADYNSRHNCSALQPHAIAQANKTKPSPSAPAARSAARPTATAAAASPKRRLARVPVLAGHQEARVPCCRVEKSRGREREGSHQTTLSTEQTGSSSSSSRWPCLESSALLQAARHARACQQRQRQRTAVAADGPAAAAGQALQVLLCTHKQQMSLLQVPLRTAPPPACERWGSPGTWTAPPPAINSELEEAVRRKRLEEALASGTLSWLEGAVCTNNRPAWPPQAAGSACTASGTAHAMPQFRTLRGG